MREADHTKMGYEEKLATLNDLFLRVAAAGNPRAILWQDEFGHWRPISSDQIYQRVRALALAFRSWGVKKGDRILLVSENRWEWAITDFAALAIGAVDVPVYPTLTGEQIAAQAADAEARIAVVSTRQQYDKLRAVLDRTQLERIAIMDAAAPPEAAASFREILDDVDARGAERDPEFDALARSAQPEDLATLIYTSGTTGEPKGVMLTHGNVAANHMATAEEFDINAADASISFLPLSHVTARVLDYILYARGAQLIYCSQFDRAPAALREVRPTIFVGVPRVFEKIRQEIERRAACSPAKRRLLAWALCVGLRHADAVYDGVRPRALAWRLVHKLVYAKVQAAFGGRVRIFVSGGAPLGLGMTRWFAAMGIAAWEGYGLTETSPVIALNTPKTHRMGSVGKPLPILETRFDTDGELLARGPSVFHGYWRKPEATAAVFDEEGFFRTGDIGRLDADGFLFITDRKKELLKTSGGKLVAPQPIENKLKTSLYVAQAALVGDRHKYVSALIAPNFAALAEWAEQHGVRYDSRAQLVADPRTVALYAEIVRDVNCTLANFEMIKRFKVVAEEWSQETGELTPSVKLKRRVVNERYADAIAALYADEATSGRER
jgi:long-chain acyl-CoA synthetase